MDQRLEMGSVETRAEGEELVIAARGDWTLRAVPDLDHRMAAIKPQGARRAKLDLTQISAIDSAGAWLISRTRASLEKAGLKVSTEAAAPAHEALIDKIVEMGVPPPAKRVGHHYLVEIVAGIGTGLFHAGKQARDLLDFFGAVVIGFFRQFVQPRRIRIISPPARNGGICSRSSRRAQSAPEPVGPSILWPLNA